MANGWTGFIGSITHFFRISGVWVRACERDEYVDTGDKDNGDILICVLLVYRVSDARVYGMRYRERLDELRGTGDGVRLLVIRLRKSKKFGVVRSWEKRMSMVRSVNTRAEGSVMDSMLV
jgi:hypothetical protein